MVVLAGAPGVWIGEIVELREPMEKNTVLGRIHNLYGGDVAKASEDGQIFGSRSSPMVKTGAWRCFYAVSDEVRDGFVG